MFFHVKRRSCSYCHDQHSASAFFPTSLQSQAAPPSDKSHLQSVSLLVSPASTFLIVTHGITLHPQAQYSQCDFLYSGCPGRLSLDFCHVCLWPLTSPGSLRPGKLSILPSSTTFFCPAPFAILCSSLALSDPVCTPLAHTSITTVVDFNLMSHFSPCQNPNSYFCTNVMLTCANSTKLHT